MRIPSLERVAALNADCRGELSAPWYIQYGYRADAINGNCRVGGLFT